MKNTESKNYLKTWLPLLIWMLIIFLFSNRPTIRTAYFDPLDFIIKKTAHLSEYAILFLFAFRAFYQTWEKRLTIEMIENIAIAIALFYAVSDEWHQSFIAGRTATVRDILIDFIGILIGLSVVKYIKYNKKWNKTKYFVYGSK